MDSQTDRATLAHHVQHARQIDASPAYQDWLLDEALAETFPASDPISPSYVD